MKNCGTCAAFTVTEGAPEGHGECHFGPPTAMVIGMAQPQAPAGLRLQGMQQLPPQPVFGGVWPPVRAHLGCCCWTPGDGMALTPATDNPAPKHASTCISLNAENQDCDCGYDPASGACKHPNTYQSSLTGRTICDDCGLVL